MEGKGGVLIPKCGSRGWPFGSFIQHTSPATSYSIPALLLGPENSNSNINDNNNTMRSSP